MPSGADAYILKNVIHDWNNGQHMGILRNIHAAMNERGRILPVGLVVPESNEPSLSKPVDLQILVTVGGKERTADEFRKLLEAAGFRLTRIVPTRSPMSVIEGAHV